MEGASTTSPSEILPRKVLFKKKTMGYHFLLAPGCLLKTGPGGGRTPGQGQRLLVVNTISDASRPVMLAQLFPQSRSRCLRFITATQQQGCQGGGGRPPACEKVLGRGAALGPLDPIHSSFLSKDPGKEAMGSEDGKHGRVRATFLALPAAFSPELFIEMALGRQIF